MSARRRKLLVAAAVPIVALVAFAIVWFEPQALFLDDRVDEAPPTVSAATGTPTTTRDVIVLGGTDAVADPAEPEIVAAGTLRGVEGHDVAAGEAQLHRLPDGTSVLRLEGLDAENGPDLKVYLSAAPGDADPDAHDDDYVSLGDLKGNIGSSNYEIDPDVDLARYRTAVIWCERFSVGFAVAQLD